MGGLNRSRGSVGQRVHEKTHGPHQSVSSHVKTHLQDAQRLGMTAASSDRPMVFVQRVSLFSVKAIKVHVVAPGMYDVVWPFRFSLLP